MVGSQGPGMSLAMRLEQLLIRQSTQTLVNTVPETTEKEFNAAVDAASQAYKTWSQTSILRRQQVMFQ